MLPYWHWNNFFFSLFFFTFNFNFKTLSTAAGRRHAFVQPREVFAPKWSFSGGMVNGEKSMCLDESETDPTRMCEKRKFMMNSGEFSISQHKRLLRQSEFLRNLTRLMWPAHNLLLWWNSKKNRHFTTIGTEKLTNFKYHLFPPENFPNCKMSNECSL